MNKLCKECLHWAVCGALIAAEVPLVREEEIHLDHTHRDRYVEFIKPDMQIVASTSSDIDFFDIRSR